MRYKEITKIKDVHGSEVIFYSTVDIKQEPIIGISITGQSINNNISYACHFNKKEIKRIIKAISARLEELEKPEKEQTLTGDEIIRNLEKRIESLELSLYSLLSNNNNKNNVREKNWNYPTIPPIMCKED